MLGAARLWWAGAALALRLASAPAAPPEPMPVPVAQQLTLILKVLTYDRNFGSRARGELRVGVVVPPNDPGSARSEIAEGFQTIAAATVKGLRLRTTVLEFASEAQLESALRAAQVTVLYVAPGNAANIDAIARVARAQRIVTVTGVPDYVPQGIVVGIGVQQDKPQIVINLPASHSAGSDFDASLLRIAKIVR